MKSSDMKKVIESQRYLLTDLLCAISFVEDDKIKSLIKMDVENLWTLTEVINNSFKLNAMGFDEIVQHGKEVVALKELYSLEYDKDKPN